MNITALRERFHQQVYLGFRTGRFARRQERWFRRDPRIRWQAIGEPGISEEGRPAAEALVAVRARLLEDWSLCA